MTSVTSIPFLNKLLSPTVSNVLRFTRIDLLDFLEIPYIDSSTLSSVGREEQQKFAFMTVDLLNPSILKKNA